MGATTRAAVVCTGKIEYRESPYLAEWLALRDAVPEDLWKEAKLTIPTPNYRHIQLQPGTAWTAGSGYASDDEYFDDRARSGGFEPLRFLPKGKNVVLGLVSTKKAAVIAEAQGATVEEALDCLALSPQCGFSSSSLAGGVGMTEGRMWEKLELVKSIAEEVWPGRS